MLWEMLCNKCIFSKESALPKYASYLENDTCSTCTSCWSLHKILAKVVYWYCTSHICSTHDNEPKGPFKNYVVYQYTYCKIIKKLRLTSPINIHNIYYMIMKLHIVRTSIIHTIYIIWNKVGVLWRGIT